MPPLDNEPPAGYHHRRIRPSPFHSFASAILTVPDSAPLLSVVIVNLNTRDWLQGCLESLGQQDVFERIQVVVVDNASTDGSAAMVRRDFPSCGLVQLEETVGFGQASNAGARHAGAPLLLLLNQDTVVGEGSLGEFIELLKEHSRCGMAGGLVYDGDGELERSTGSFPTLSTMVLDRLLGLLPPARGLLGLHSERHWTGYGQARRVDWVTGAYLWIRRELFEELGGFDENIFLYCEDVDLAYRARRAGAECWFFPRAPIVHYRSKTPAPRSRKEMQRESLHYFASKHYRATRFCLTRMAFRLMRKLT